MENKVSASFVVKKIGKRSVVIGDFKNSEGILSDQPDIKAREGNTVILTIEVVINEAPGSEPGFGVR